MSNNDPRIRKQKSYFNPSFILILPVVLCLAVMSFMYVYQDGVTVLVFPVPQQQIVQNMHTDIQFTNYAQTEGVDKLPIVFANPSEMKEKLILFYTPFFGDKPWHFVDTDYFSKCKCDVSKCKVTYNASLIKQSDVVIFHGRDMPNTVTLDQLNKQRNEIQRWGYFILESPVNSPPVHIYDKYFNWSISYRLNSDFRWPYYRYRQVKTTREPMKNYAEGRTLKILWFVSHCGTSRDLFIRKLEDQSVRVDVVGGCASNFKHKLDCPRNNLQCTNTLKTYKFYFSGENSFCKDYITEKYYVQGVGVGRIPIVLGGADYINPKLAIPGSYINVLDFQNVKEFADYIKMLDKNDTAYNEYFKWKSNWETYEHPSGCAEFVCDMCKKLHSTNIEKDRPLSVQMTGDCEEPTRRYNEWIKTA